MCYHRRSVSGAVTAARPIAAVQLAYTVDAGPWQERAWQHAPATLDGARVAADLPPGWTACFLTATDDLGGYGSSPHVAVEDPGV